MASLPKRKPTLSVTNPITSDENLAKLISETKDIKSEDAFKGWKESFLEQYKKYLDPAGVENAEASNGRLVRSLEKLAKTVITVNEFVKEGKISKETQSVQGQRHLTNMTEQMAASEKEVARFMPTTGAEEEEIGYDKFELGAVMIEDGFHVYEHLKTTKDIVEHLQEIVLKDVLTSNKLSIIQFYLRQIQIFCDVMSDLGLFGLMERMMEVYKIKPRSKAKPAMESPPEPEHIEEEEQPVKPERVLDPNKKYNFRAAYTGGFIDPFSGTQPGREEFEDPDDDNKDDLNGDGEDDDNHFVIYFDAKTGAIGKIPRKFCKGIVTEDEKGEEQLQGEIVDNEEKEKLIWDMKKAMKSSGPGTPKQGPKRTSSGKSNALRGLHPPLESPKKAPPRTRSGKSDRVERSMSLNEGPPRQPPAKSRSGGSLRGSRLTGEPTSDGGEKAKSVAGSDGMRSPFDATPSVSTSGTAPLKSGASKSPGTLSKPKVGRMDESAKTSSSTSTKPERTRRASATSIAESPSPSSDGWAKPGALAASKRTQSERNNLVSAKKDPVTKHVPSSTGWSSPSTLAK